MIGHGEMDIAVFGFLSSTIAYFIGTRDNNFYDMAMCGTTITKTFSASTNIRFISLLVAALSAIYLYLGNFYGKYFFFATSALIDMTILGALPVCENSNHLWLTISMGSIMSLVTSDNRLTGTIILIATMSCLMYYCIQLQLRYPYNDVIYMIYLSRVTQQCMFNVYDRFVRPDSYKTYIIQLYATCALLYYSEYFKQESYIWVTHIILTSISMLISL